MEDPASNCDKNNESFKCGDCDFQSMKKNLVRIHYKEVHVRNRKSDSNETTNKLKIESKTSIDPKVEGFKCEHCDYVARFESWMKKHVEAVHIKLKKFKCKVCDYAASQICNLSKHMKTIHNDDIFFRCNICNYKSRIKKLFQRHLKHQHFQFQCKLCDFKSSRQDLLNQHEKDRSLVALQYRP